MKNIKKILFLLLPLFLGQQLAAVDCWKNVKLAGGVASSCACAALVYSYCFSKTEQEKSLGALDALISQAQLIRDGKTQEDCYLANVYQELLNDLALLSDEDQEVLNDCIVRFDVAIANNSSGALARAYQHLNACVDAIRSKLN